MGDERTQSTPQGARDSADDLTNSTPARTPSPSSDIPSAEGLSGSQATSAGDIPLTHRNVLYLQRTIGNRAVGRLIQTRLKVGQPGDEYEREADEVAEEVARRPEGQEVQRQTPDAEGRRKRPAEEGAVQTKPSDAVSAGHHAAASAEEEQRRRRPEEIRPKSDGGGSAPDTPDVEAQVDNVRGGGEQLPGGVRADMEAQLGQDFGQVRVHRGSQAAEAAEAVNAKAYTRGTDVVFGAGQYAPETREGRRLLAHELTHVVQQGAAGERVQRYEAGEHAQLGETQAELKQAYAPTSYVVKKGERLGELARRFGLTPAELKAANKEKLKSWPAADGGGHTVEGFDAGETISVPQKLNDFAKAATKDKSATFTVNGVVLEYGVGIAMGDLYETPEQMSKASPAELKALAALIKSEQTTGKLVSTQEWQKATGGRYLKLAEENVPHFAPQNAARATKSPAGAAGPDHKSEWERYHKAALEASVTGDKDRALMLNAFADHFLTDAFSAGHLINKPDVMEMFKGQLRLDAAGKEFTPDSQKFFDAVAAAAFTGAVKTEFSKYETYEVFKYKDKYWTGAHPDIDSAERFSALLQGIHKENPDLVANAVAKGAHDRLNTFPGGIPVENARGDPPWKLSGDATLNDETRNVARKAVAQSQFNVISVYKMAGPLDAPAMFSRVWDYTPRPSTAGLKLLVAEVKKSTDIGSVDLRQAVVNLIKANYMLIISELVSRKKLRKA